MDVLRYIKPSNLSIQMVYDAWAWSINDKIIYEYTSWKPEDNFNAIYDDMPMEGWWPWPKKEEPGVSEKGTEGTMLK